MRKNLIFVFALLIFFSGYPFEGYGQPGNSSKIYYVSPSGDDLHPGSMEKPWKKPGYASKKLKAGDTLVIRSGEYFMEEFDVDMITLENSGTKDAWIFIKGEEGKRPVIKGRKNLLAAIDISGRNYIRIENLEITGDLDKPYSGGLREGIDAGGSADPEKGAVSNVIFRDIEVHHVEEGGINFAGNIQDVLLDRVHVHHAAGFGIGGPSAGSGRGWERVKIANCLLEYMGFFSHGKEERTENDRPDGLGMEASEGPLEVANTISRYNLGDGLDSKSRNTYIHHCLVANNYGDGVKLWGTKSRVENTLIFGTGFTTPSLGTPWQLITIDTEDKSASFELNHVTIFDDPRRANQHYPMTVQYDNRNIQVKLVLKNSIISGLSRVFISGNVDLQMQNNIFFNRKDGDDVQLEIDGKKEYSPKDLPLIGTGNKFADPAFVTPSWGADGNFHLRDGSPGIDQATSQGFPPDDLDGKKRPIGKGADIGAYEK